MSTCILSCSKTFFLPRYLQYSISNLSNFYWKEKFFFHFILLGLSKWKGDKPWRNACPCFLIRLSLQRCRPPVASYSIYLIKNLLRIKIYEQIILCVVEYLFRIFLKHAWNRGTILVHAETWRCRGFIFSETMEVKSGKQIKLKKKKQLEISVALVLSVRFWHYLGAGMTSKLQRLFF